MTPGRASSGAETSEPANLPYRKAEYVTSSNDVSAYPTGCGLWVTLSRSGNVLTGSALTSCTANQSRIWQKVTIQRSRWYGWETMASVTDWRNNVASFALDLPYNCGGTGTHDFRAISEGQVTTYSGQIYTASAYDQIDGVACT